LTYESGGKPFLENGLLLNFPADGYISLEYEEKPDDPIADIQANRSATFRGFFSREVAVDDVELPSRKLGILPLPRLLPQLRVYYASSRS
jgi:hypothetical protein